MKQLFLMTLFSMMCFVTLGYAQQNLCTGLPDKIDDAIYYCTNMEIQYGYDIPADCDETDLSETNKQAVVNSVNILANYLRNMDVVVTLLERDFHIQNTVNTNYRGDDMQEFLNSMPNKTIDADEEVITKENLCSSLDAEIEKMDRSCVHLDFAFSCNGGLENDEEYNAFFAPFNDFSKMFTNKHAVTSILYEKHEQ